MELMQRVQNFKRNLDNSDDPNVPWYRRKRTFFLGTIMGLVLVGVLVLFFGGYFAGLSAYKEQEKDDEIPDPEPRVLPPIEWEGVCPKKATKCPSSFQGIPPLILVSLDGFRPDFLDRGFTPTIKNIATCGTHAPYMFPVFPTKTFPNHFSQVTGVNPPTHGIIDNNIYDPLKRKLFKVGTPESLEPYWWLKEPIWVTAQKQGKKSACYYWPGSEVKINYTFPTYYKKYNAKVPFNSRVDQVLRWLDLLPDSRPNFLTLYVNEPDHALHYFGTKSKQLNDALAKVDRMIERLFSGLQQRYLVGCVNVIIVSDHGMSDTDCKRVIELQNLINVNETFNTVGAFGRIRPKGKRNTTAVDEIVTKLRCKNNHMRIYPKEQLPVRLHYADSPRIEPIFVDIDAGWTVVSKLFKPDDGICSGGSHGYDNMFPDMRAIFLAHGPSFKQNFTMQPFINIELYEMMTELIGISPNPNNGTRGSMHYIMTSPHLLLPKQEQPPAPAVAKVPSDDDEYNDRIIASRCSCPQTDKQTEVQNIDATKDLHSPFGIPYDAQDHSSLQLLYNEDYISAFSSKFRIPMWSAFTIKEENEYKKLKVDCWTGDARIPHDNVPKCDDYDMLQDNDQAIFQQPLFPPGFSGSAPEQASFITNSIAKSQNYSTVLEEPLYQILSRWASQSSELNVVTGPAFNIFFTGVKPSSEDLMRFSTKNSPVLIPTHIFFVLTWCSEKISALQSCQTSKLKAHAFLLPNQPFLMNCEPPKDFIAKNSARVVDVEKFTGISFYTELPIYDAIRLRTMMPERTL